MKIPEAAMGSDWAWSLPLIVLTVVFHVFGLGLINENVVNLRRAIVTDRYSKTAFVVFIGVTVLAATILHAVEGMIWAAAYRFLGALPDNESAVLYSMSAMTSYGHANLFLEGRWQLMGALEALNGMMLFGLTTAFLFTMMWPIVGTRKEPPK